MEAHWLRQLALGMTLAMAWPDVAQADATVFEELSFLVWGPNIKEEVFKRWTQGFYPSLLCKDISYCFI